MSNWTSVNQQSMAPIIKASSDFRLSPVSPAAHSESSTEIISSVESEAVIQRGYSEAPPFSPLTLEMATTIARRNNSLPSTAPTSYTASSDIAEPKVRRSRRIQRNQRVQQKKTYRKLRLICPPKPPICRINCRFYCDDEDSSNFGMMRYVYRGQIYWCPPHIKPWTREERFLLRPQHNYFMPMFGDKTIASDVLPQNFYYSDRAHSPCFEKMYDENRHKKA